MIKWVLFCLMAATVPVFYFMFVVAGFLPVIGIAVLAIRGDASGFRLFNVIHLVVYVPALYFIAAAVARRLSSLSPRAEFVGVAAISVALIVLSFLPLYSIGHNAVQGVNLYRLFRSGVLG